MAWHSAVTAYFLNTVRYLGSSFGLELMLCVALRVCFLNRRLVAVFF